MVYDLVMKYDKPISYPMPIAPYKRYSASMEENHNEPVDVELCMIEPSVLEF